MKSHAELGPEVVKDPSPDHGRRRLLAGLVSSPIALIALPPLGAVLSAQDPPLSTPNSPFSRAFDFSSLRDWITPNDEFFLRSHFGVPPIALSVYGTGSSSLEHTSTTPATASGISSWPLRITGAVDRERTLALADLSALASVEVVATLECAGNLTGWGGVSNARWTGVRLGDVIRTAAVSARAADVVLIGADGGLDREAGVKAENFARAIPLKKALDSSTILALNMNGAPLPVAHGGPVRAIVPGWYGMDSVKWLREISLSREPFTGFYQTERYYEARRSRAGAIQKTALEQMRIKSQIARPKRGGSVRAGQLVQIAGAAWGGNSEVAAVEVSVDGGAHWSAARLGLEQSSFSWRLWYYDWRPTETGTVEIAARARDVAGYQQPLYRDASIITPYANNWVDRHTVVVTG